MIAESVSQTRSGEWTLRSGRNLTIAYTPGQGDRPQCNIPGVWVHRKLLPLVEFHGPGPLHCRPALIDHLLGRFLYLGADLV